MTDHCSWPRCRALADVIYLEQPYCTAHWAKLCDQQERDTLREWEQRDKLRAKSRHEETEDQLIGVTLVDKG